MPAPGIGTTVVDQWTAEYRSRFKEWDTRAVVRHAHTMKPFAAGLHYFSPDVCVLFSHPAVGDAPTDVQEGVLVLSLFDWLEFTVWLETGPVNASCEFLRRPHFLPWLPSEMRADALKIYTDEAGHAQMSYDLARAVELKTGYTSLQLRPRFLETFKQLTRPYDGAGAHVWVSPTCPIPRDEQSSEHAST